jgi:hypothetical protein
MGPECVESSVKQLDLGCCDEVEKLVVMGRMDLLNYLVSCGAYC